MTTQANANQLKVARKRSREVRSRGKSAEQLFAEAGLRCTEDEKRRILEKLKEMPESYRRTYLKAMRGSSMRAAIEAFCIGCVVWQQREVELCTALDCPLYPYRPYK